ncbi:MAG TPA: PHP domain-containing protein [Rectinemataceae bacterium]|nr:PHP domain-containing protein [Rectinemataceae bacterium]
MIDLHTHSSASDGALSPAELVALAKKTGLKALALTDHDTVAGVAEARLTSAELSIVLIAGVEIEIEFDPGEFHLLGLGIDEKNASLLNALSVLAEARRDRNARIVELFKSDGISLDLEEIAKIAGTERIGRPHLADALLRRKIVRTRQEAFDRFLGKGKPFYLPKDCFPLAEAQSLIKAAGGISVIAHPYSLFVSKSKLANLMDEWKEAGIEGVEAYHPTAKLGQCRILETMARERGFLVTAGSDYHNREKPECGLGKTAGGIPIADSYYEELSRSLSWLPALT